MSQVIRQTTSPLQRYVALAWYVLRSPKVTLTAAGILTGVMVLRLVLPQQPTSLTTAAARTLWVSDLPYLVRPWGGLLYALGFARILQSVWFWLPLSLLFLNSLVALADYGPGAWRRFHNPTPPVTWRHPLAQRAEQSVRLPESPDPFLESLKINLSNQGFFIYDPAASEERMVGASFARWSWLGTAGFYLGIIFLAVACLISYHFALIDRFTLLPFEKNRSRLFEGAFELAGFKASGENIGKLTYTPLEDEDSTSSSASPVLQELTWRLYRPAIFDNVLVWPFATELVLTIEVQDESGSYLKLIPVQENLPPADRLNLHSEESDRPLYFSISSPRLAVQILPAATDGTYNVQARRGSETAPFINRNVQSGQTFDIGRLSARITPNYALQVWAYRDPASLLYLTAFVLLVAGVVAILLRSPIQLWLIPDVKGRGGQLYGVVESFGSTDKITRFLKELFSEGESDANAVTEY